MTPSDLTPKQRQLVMNMADLWVRQNGIASAAEALTIAALMQQADKEPAPGSDPLD